jgi:hypothetical protein
MTLIIEDGTGTDPTANSYASVDEMRAHALLRGNNLAEKSDSEMEGFLIQAMDYLESKASKFKGDIANETQPLQWPRSGVWGVFYPGAYTAANEIPVELKRAQIELAIDAIDGDLMPTTRASDKGRVISETLPGAISINYADSGSVSSVSKKANSYLNRLYKRSGLTAVRA